MFSAAAHHPIISLFSSTGSSPLSLFSTQIDSESPKQSCICLLHDARSEPLPAPPAALLQSPSTPTSTTAEPQGANAASASLSDSQGYTLDQNVLHMQSPDLRRTFIQCPPVRKRSSHRIEASIATTGGMSTTTAGRSLGIRHPWIHLQVRSLGKDWSFEVGLVDTANRMGILRLSTFQTEPKIKLRDSKPPILHLPLSFPDASSRPLTSWTTVNLHLPTYLPHFSSSSLTSASSSSAANEIEGQPSTSFPIPKGNFSHVSYVRVYATCRLRRIWFSEANASGLQIPWEFELYACD